MLNEIILAKALLDMLVYSVPYMQVLGLKTGEMVDRSRVLY